MKLLIAVLLLFVSAGYAQTNGTITAQDSGACTTAGACVSLPLPSNAGAVGLSISGTFSATVQFEVSADNGTTWVSAQGTSPSAATASSATAAGIWRFAVSGLTNFRVRGSAYSSGSVNVTIQYSPTAASTGSSSGGGLPSGVTSPGAAQLDFTEVAAPANPSAGIDRFYFNSTTHQLSCLTSSGGNCAPSGGTGTPATPLNAVQANGGGGNFSANANVQLDTTNGYLGVKSPNGLPSVPVDIAFTGQSRAGVLTVLSFNCGYTSTSASPADIHCMNGTLTLSGTDAAFTDGTDAVNYFTLTDSRTPSGASVAGHQFVGGFRENWNGGPNLTCTVCASIYVTASAAPTGGTGSIYGLDVEGGPVSGTGNITWYGVGAAIPSVTNGTGPAYTGTGIAVKTDPSTVQHGTGTGCMAGVAVGSGICSTASSNYAFFSDSASNSSLLQGLSLGKNAQPVQRLDVYGGIEVGADNASQSDIILRSKNNGSAVINLKMPLANPSTINVKWPDVSGTIANVIGDYDNSSGITGNLASQSLFTAPDSNARFIDASAYVECTTGVASSTVTVNFTFTDDIGASTQSSSAFSCATTGSRFYFPYGFYSAGGGNITVSTTTANSPQYKFHAQATDKSQSTNST